MKLKDGMLLYHGSYTSVENIDLNQCMNGKDFGKGFYLTSGPNQARNFIRSSLIKAQNTGNAPITQNYGYVSSFRYHKPEQEIAVHEFENADREWLWFISQKLPDHLYDQYCFLTEDAVGCLEFQEARKYVI